MRPPAARTGAVGATAFVLLAAVPVITGAVTPAQAATTTTTVTYTRCDVRTVGSDPSTRVGPVFSWSPTIKVDIDSPVRTDEDVTARITISDFPANKIPVGLPAPYTYFTGMIGSTDGDTYFGKTVRAAQPAGQPIALGETEDDYWFDDPGMVAWFAHEFTMSTEGWDGPNNTGTWRRYYVKCDKPANPTRIATIPAWDPAAKAALSLSTARLVQGTTIRATGTGFRPDESVTVTLDRTKLSEKATTVLGGVTHSWTAGAYLAPGTHTFTLSSSISGKTVKKSFAVVAASAKASMKPSKAKRGKKTTVNGWSFKPGERVTVVMRRTSSGKGLKSKTIGTFTANASGKVTKKFAVSKKFAKGKHRLTLTGASSKRVATTNLTLTK